MRLKGLPTGPAPDFLSLDVVWQRLDAVLLLELLRRLGVLPLAVVRRRAALRKVNDVDVDGLRRKKEKSKVNTNAVESRVQLEF